MHDRPRGCVTVIRQLQRSNAGHNTDHDDLGLTSLHSAKDEQKCPQALYV
jgi:hypothetical protein